MTVLRDRLEALFADGLGWPCLGLGELFCSDDPQERQSVAPLCLTCLVLIECRLDADAHGEDFGIWAGVDRGVRRKKQGQVAA